MTLKTVPVQIFDIIAFR